MNVHTLKRWVELEQEGYEPNDIVFMLIEEGCNVSDLVALQYERIPSDSPTIPVQDRPRTCS